MMRNLDIDLILCTLSGIPPVNWLSETWEEDQRIEWDRARRFFNLVYRDLMSFFSDTPSPLDCLPKNSKKREEIRSATRFYLSFYEGVREKWNSLSNYLAKADLQKLGIKNAPQSPGETISLIILQDARNCFEPCLKYSEITSRSQYQSTVEYRKIQKFLNNISRTQAEEKELQKLKKRREKLKKQMGIDTRKKLKDFCLTILKKEYAGDRTENPYKVLMKRHGDLERTIAKENHPSKSASKEVWSGGIRSPS